MLFLSVLCAVIGLALHSRRLPWQNLIAAALLIFASASAVEVAARAWQLPFTPLRLKDTSFWCLPIVWIAALSVSRKVAQVCFARRRGTDRYGLWILATTVVLTTVLWSVAEAIGGRFNALNIVGRLATSLILLLVIFPWLIEKRPRVAAA